MEPAAERTSECCGTADSWLKAMSDVLRRMTLHGEVKSVPPRGQKPVVGVQTHEGSEPHQEREGRTRETEAEARGRATRRVPQPSIPAIEGQPQTQRNAEGRCNERGRRTRDAEAEGRR